MLLEPENKAMDIPRALRQIVRGSPRGMMELDRVEGFWVVTSWPAADVILRLRVVYDTYEEPCQLYFDARMRGEREFYELGGLETHLYLLWDENHEYRLHMDDLPNIWRGSFRQMVRCWAAACWILDYGSVSQVRYAAAPKCLRDCLEFPS